MKRLRVLISGRVQGVAYRYWTQDAATRRGLDGWVRNLADGRVEALFQGDPMLVDEMIAACHDGPRLASVTRVETFETGEPAAAGFQILLTGR